MSNTPDVNIWNTNPHINPKSLHPKKKHTWGLPEVLISLIIFLCTQVALTILVLFMATSNVIASGETDVAVTLELLEGIIYSPMILIISSASMYLSWGVMMWYSTRVRGHKSWAKDFWFRFNLPKDIFIGLGVGLFGLMLVQGLSMLLQALGVNMDEAGNTEIFEQQQGFWKYFFFIAMVSLIGPTMEELFFRGFVMQALIKHFRRGNISSPRGSLSSWVQRNNAALFSGYLKFRNWGFRHKYMISAIISSIFFGLMHFQGPSLGQMMTVVITGLLGFVFALVTLKTKRLAPAIFGHIAYNGTVAMLTLFVL